MGKLKEFLKRKDVVFSAHRYGIDAMGAMAQGLFASLLIGTIIKTLGEQIGLQFLVDAGTFAQSVAGPAMAASIGYALHTPPLVLFSLIAVGSAANSPGRCRRPPGRILYRHCFGRVRQACQQRDQSRYHRYPGGHHSGGHGSECAVCPCHRRGGFCGGQRDHVGH